MKIDVEKEQAQKSSLYTTLLFFISASPYLSRGTTELISPPYLPASLLARYIIRDSFFARPDLLGRVLKDDPK